MSELSELITTHANAISEKERAEDREVAGVFVKVDKSKMERETAYLSQAREHYAAETLKTIRRVYRHFVGAAPFESTTDAVDKTYERMINALVPVVISVFSDGILVGQDTFAVKRAVRMESQNQVESMFVEERFRTDSNTHGVLVSCDEDTMNLFRGLLTGTLGMCGTATGYSQYTGPAVNKIWDLWLLVMESVVTAMYSAGVSIGKEYHENEILRGIQEKTNEAD